MKEHRTLKKTQCGASFAKTPVSIIFGVSGCISFFVLWAKQHRCGKKTKISVYIA